MKRTVYFLLLLSFPAILLSQYELQSPDGNCRISISDGDLLQYSVSYRGKQVILPSSLGFEFVNQPDFGRNVGVTASSKEMISTYWTPVWGKHNRIHDYYNSMDLEITERAYPRRKFKLNVRAYNDGIAFRYFVTVNNGISNSVVNELTALHFAGDFEAWIADFKGYKSHQEEEFMKRKLGEVNGEERPGTPLLFKVDKDCYGAVLEANIDNYPGMYFRRDEDIHDGVAYLVSISPPRDKDESAVKAVLSENQHSPWRVIMLADNPGRFIESDIILNLNEPCEIEDPSWIVPGLCAWDHWWSGEVQMDTKTIKQYIDLASSMGWPYMLIDWQWYGPFDQPDSDITGVNPDVDMPEVLEYAKSNNVRCWLWLYWTDAARMYEKAFPLYREWGIAGVKIDFMQYDDQEMVNWYKTIIRTAAENHLMVNFHGAYRPDGIRRTWPNMMTREGVLGNEYNKWSSRITPEHNTTLPFTRMLAGPMDFTPGGFLNRTPETFQTGVPANVMTTRTQQLAMFIVYDSPVITVCDHPDHYYNQPGLDFLRGIPASWDETRFIEGSPGEYLAVAKRSGNEWFLGIMNNSFPRDVKISLDFLGEGTFRATLYSDAENSDESPETLKIRVVRMKPTDSLNLRLASGGGAAARFIEE